MTLAGDLIYVLLGVLYLGALGIRLFLGLAESGWGILDGVQCLGLELADDIVVDTFEDMGNLVPFED